MLKWFKKKQTDLHQTPETAKDIALVLHKTLKRLQVYEPNAMIRVPYYCKVFLLRMGFRQKDISDKHEDTINIPYDNSPTQNMN